MSDTPQSQKNALDQTMEHSAAGGQGKTTAASSSSGKKHTGGSVFTYLAIMFAAAFLMLLLAYFIQQRNNDAAISGLQSSLDQFQSMDELLDENRALREENDTLEDENGSLQQELDSANEAWDKWMNTANDLLAQNDSWAYFYAIDDLYRAEQYEACAQKIAEIQTTTSYNTPDAARERAKEIADALLELGYLDQNTASLLVGDYSNS